MSKNQSMSKKNKKGINITENCLYSTISELIIQNTEK